MFHKIHTNFIVVTLVIPMLLLSGCCFPGTETTINDDGVILWKGAFPHDLNKIQEERKDAVLIRVKLNNEYFGNVETRNKNLELVFVDRQGKETNLWKYVDYGAVEIISFNHKEEILRLYFDRAIIGIRNKHYVTQLNIKTLKVKTFLIKCGEWYI
ncbi:MAG: hypothetical protein JW914_02130 [Syntrophaceae bacterium]|nr:hypothetical protein [Syntrophaceae bacterium]